MPVIVMGVAAIAAASAGGGYLVMRRRRNHQQGGGKPEEEVVDFSGEQEGRVQLHGVWLALSACLRARFFFFSILIL